MGGALAGSAALDGGSALDGGVPGSSGTARAIARAYTAYGLPLGVAFQLRDDILGVFGDPAHTGKPAGDDVREGKRTVLLALTRARADARQAAIIDQLLGDPKLDEAGVAEIRAVITGTGALAECELTIERHVAQALSALDAAPVTDEAKAALAELAVAATTRRG